MDLGVANLVPEYGLRNLDLNLLIVVSSKPSLSGCVIFLRKKSKILFHKRVVCTLLHHMRLLHAIAITFQMISVADYVEKFGYICFVYTFCLFYYLIFTSVYIILLSIHINYVLSFFLALLLLLIFFLFFFYLSLLSIIYIFIYIQLLSNISSREFQNG